MTIVGIGSDLCNIDRIQKSIDRFGERCGVAQALEFGHSVLALHMGVTPGVKLDHRRTEPQGRVDLPLARLDEQAHPDPRVGQPLDEWPQ